MQKVLLHLESPDGNQEFTLESEISFGRTNLAQIVVNDASLSRLHATIFRENNQIWIADENSTNGVFVNGERIENEKLLQDKDEIRLGNDTNIFIEITEKVEVKHETPKPQKIEKVQKTKPKKEKQKIPMFVILSVFSMFLIIFVAVIALLLVNKTEVQSTNSSVKTTPIIRSSEIIPRRVIDPLGNEDQEDLADLIEMLDADVEDVVQNADDFGEVASTSSDDKSVKPSDLNVPISFWKQQRDLALASRGIEPIGNDPPGTVVPIELRGDGVIKQKAKLREMLSENYQQPMDFAELAQKRINKELVEMPMATDTYLLDVGGSASEGEFISFSFDTGTNIIAQGTPKYQTIQQLAGNFDGQKYDLGNQRDRKQIRIRLLRMFHPRARPILERLAKAYFDEFKRPLRVTSLTRSMDYQISLNKINPNSFMVRGKGSLPPHTSGCAFDLARKHMTAKEQNFVMKKLAEMEREGILDALREGNANACFHVFIYDDGKPPKM
jgi:pSer/pThr/pTyr-binding forkhead associated (FHA) protein